MARKQVAVMFGGRSPEHDVSVISGLQALQAVDSAQYDAFPLYLDLNGQWWTGEALRERANFLPNEALQAKLMPVTLEVAPSGQGVLLPRRKSLFGGAKPQVFDAALLAFHGLIGEDGNLQGLFEAAGVPYTGLRTMPAALFMDKAATKLLAQALQIPVLPFILHRKGPGALDAARLGEKLAGMSFPLIVKPNHLGSSIGVAAVQTVAEAVEVLATIFRYDDAAIIEPCLTHFREYNIAAMHKDSAVLTSAIERPKRSDELLTFKEKYLSGGGKKTGAKMSGASTEGMLSLTRELNPVLPQELESDIRDYAARIVGVVTAAGAPRLDFIFDETTQRLYLNEINPCPGSFAYFLWEASQYRMGFVALLNHLLAEAFACRDKVILPADPVPPEARLLRRP